MSIYSTPIIAAVIVLLVIGFFIAIPWMIHNYRKFGFLSFWTTLVIFSFTFYALAAYFLVILPLPEVRDTCGMENYSTQRYQLIPFYFLYEILKGSHIVWTQPSTYINFVRHSSFLPAFLNVLILFPLGVYMGYFRGKTMSLKGMLLVGFSVSLFFEITQLTALYGIYTCPYRLFNVDDLILNTFGAGMGFLIAPAILALLPSKEQVLEKSDRVFKEGIVRPLPQLLAIVVDYIVVTIIWFVVSGMLKVDDPIINLLFIAIGMFVLQFLIPLVTKGSTLGTKILRFRLERVDSKRKWSLTLLKRWFALMAPWFLFQLFSIVARFSTLDIDSAYYGFHVLIQVMMLFLMFLIIFIITIHVLIVIISKKRQSFYFDKLTGIVARYNQETDKK